MSKSRLILLELNEINFDVVQLYIDQGQVNLPAFRKLMAGCGIRTASEKQYEHLEPWIQWPSVHSGRSFAEHGVFRLGDMVTADVPQIFEALERRGWKVGAISPMNAVNRLRTPAYFMPDPWTETESDGSWWTRSLGSAIAQVVNDNSQGHISWSSALHLLLGLIRFARPRNYHRYLRLVLGMRRSPWRKALFLDLFLHDLHMKLFRRERPDFSTLFVNAGAHIQHHYFLNASPLRNELGRRNPAWYVAPEVDPVVEMLCLYDMILADFLALPDAEVIVATGLSQRPYDRVKFYYRLKDHAEFLRLLGIRFKTVVPRMTRDFLVEFEDAEDAAVAASRLGCVLVCGDGERLFGAIDNRGTSLFVTLTYPDEIVPETDVEFDLGRMSLAPYVAFVAIKNGMHQETGFAYFTNGAAKCAPQSGVHVKELHSAVMDFFGEQRASKSAVA